MDRKIIVSGRPRSGTSLMMRILDVSGYNCARDKTWEENLKNVISNPYFYETKDLIKGKAGSIKKFDAGKILVNRLHILKNPEDYFIIWMHRKKESIFKSWDSYNRKSIAKVDNITDYERFDENQLLERFTYIKIDYDNLINLPDDELNKLAKKIHIDINAAKNEIDPSLRHY